MLRAATFRLIARLVLPFHDSRPRQEYCLPQLEFEIAGATRAANIDTLIVAGWTGREKAAVELHIAELATLGVRPPRTVPCFYRLGANLLTTAAAIDVVGSDSSGEVEFVLVSLDDGLHVGVGSDHTDRTVESYGVTVSKQMCPKPMSTELWKFADIEPHWDELMLRSWVTRRGKRDLYQEGHVTRMLAPRDLIARYLTNAGMLPVGTVMYGGTLPVNGSIGGGERFEIELEDPRMKRTLRHAYAAHCFDIAD